MVAVLARRLCNISHTHPIITNSSDNLCFCLDTNMFSLCHLYPPILFSVSILTTCPEYRDLDMYVRDKDVSTNIGEAQ